MPADVPLVLAFIRGLAEYEQLAHKVQATEELLSEHLFGPRPCAEVVLAELGGEAVGFALFIHIYYSFLGRPGLYLEDLFVLPEARGRGVGRRLLAHLARLAVERGCGRLDWTVLDWNEPAIGFYRRLGAWPLDEWTRYRLDGADLERLADEAGTER
jgi:GNAT superfamily N-acetyltransferase